MVTCRLQLFGSDSLIRDCEMHVVPRLGETILVGEVKSVVSHVMHVIELDTENEQKGHQIIVTYKSPGD